MKKKNRVAVIPVDPSSHISGGSILGNIARYLQLEFIKMILCSSFLLFLCCDDEDLFSLYA